MTINEIRRLEIHSPSFQQLNRINLEVYRYIGNVTG
jgi:hypothetical protein